MHAYIHAHYIPFRWRWYYWYLGGREGRLISCIFLARTIFHEQPDQPIGLKTAARLALPALLWASRLYPIPLAAPSALAVIPNSSTIHGQPGKVSGRLMSSITTSMPASSKLACRNTYTGCGGQRVNTCSVSCLTSYSESIYHRPGCCALPACTNQTHSLV